jgi:hypothetical protein
MGEPLDTGSFESWLSATAPFSVIPPSAGRIGTFETVLGAGRFSPVYINVDRPTPVGASDTLTVDLVKIFIIGTTVGAKMHTGNVGTLIKVQVRDGAAPLDISSSTAKQLIFRKPSGALLTVTAAFYTDGTDGLLSYITSAGDIDLAGTWKLQVKLTQVLNVWNSEVVEFVVDENL